MTGNPTNECPFAELAETLRALGLAVGADMGDLHVTVPRAIARTLRAWVEKHSEIRSIDDLLAALDPDTARTPWWKESTADG